MNDEFKQINFVTIILDESTDVKNFSQLFAVARFVNVDGNIQVRCLGFINLSEDRTADALCAIVCELVKNIDANNEVIDEFTKTEGRIQLHYKYVSF